MLIYKTSKDTNYNFAENDDFAYDLVHDDKLPDIIKIKNNYKYLVPFYKEVLKSHNKNNFLILSTFLIFMDDIESFHTISQNIKLIEPKKHKYIIIQQINPYIFSNLKF